MATVHLLVQGKVQGVFYRASAKKAADSNNITGWVKNTDAGDVEITASGTDEDIQQFIAWCKQGPPRANVTNVVVTKREEEKFEEFEVRKV
jgi:acylphosphatase